MNYHTVIGLEIHSELNTKTKMFCSCKNDPEEKEPNKNICPICMGHPGTLPVINKEALKKIIQIGISLGCKIENFSQFDRKNYFYPDLPKGYQISQFFHPFCLNGFLEINNRKIKIREIHLEEDTGKLMHFEKDGYSLVDFNRAGVPLMELVTEPEIESAEEARAFAEELQLILRYLDVSNANMEMGEMRVEVNISLVPVSEYQKGKLGTKVEIKNLNSFRAIEKATAFEINRQTKILSQGGKILQETRGWDDMRGMTIGQRKKEEAHDYRYFTEPDLPPIQFEKEEIEKIKIHLPELPQQKRARFKREYELEAQAIDFLVKNRDMGDYFEKTISELDPRLKKDQLLKFIKLTANYLITDVQNILKVNNIPSISDVKFLINPENFADFITLIGEEKISSRIAKTLLDKMFKTGDDPNKIIADEDLSPIVDENELEKIIKEIISFNGKAAEDYKKGKKNALQFLIGKIMQRTKGKADTKIINELLVKTLKK